MPDAHSALGIKPDGSWQDCAPFPPRAPIEIRGLLHGHSIVLHSSSCIAIAASIPYLRRDPLTWNLTLLFTGITGTAAGAMGGIVLVVFGAARRRHVMLAAGLIVGLGSFLLLALVIGWAIHKDGSEEVSLAQGTIIAPRSVETGWI